MAQAVQHSHVRQWPCRAWALVRQVNKRENWCLSEVVARICPPVHLAACTRFAVSAGMCKPLFIVEGAAFTARIGGSKSLMPQVSDDRAFLPPSTLCDFLLAKPFYHPLPCFVQAATCSGALTALCV